MDLSDHFQHQDASISRINFLRYSETEWQWIAGNEYACCNRLRAKDYLAMFGEAGFSLSRIEKSVDQEPLTSLQKAFPLDQQYLHCDLADLSTTSLKILLHV